MPNDDDDADGGKLAVLLTQQTLADFLDDESTSHNVPYLVGGEVLSSNEATGEIHWRMNDGELKGVVLRIQVSLIELPSN